MASGQRSRRPLVDGRAMPSLYTPTVEDVDAAGWVLENRSRLQRDLLQSGALLFRGFALKTVQEFRYIIEPEAAALASQRGK